MIAPETGRQDASGRINVKQGALPLATQLKSQHARGARYFIGDSLSAPDIYWTAFANLLDPLLKEQCPMPEAWRPAFVATYPVIKQVLDPLLLEHRARIFRQQFRDPMEL
jgi:hypothetical protein